jgi:hypothetical protein
VVFGGWMDASLRPGGQEGVVRSYAWAGAQFGAPFEEAALSRPAIEGFLIFVCAGFYSGFLTSCSANRNKATINANTTGPINDPMNPNAATPPITPTNTVKVETDARWRVR